MQQESKHIIKRPRPDKKLSFRRFFASYIDLIVFGSVVWPFIMYLIQINNEYYLLFGLWFSLCLSLILREVFNLSMGRMICKLEIVDSAASEKPKNSKLVLRSILISFLFLLDLFVIVITPSAISLTDVLTGTKVVRNTSVEKVLNKKVIVIVTCAVILSISLRYSVGNRFLMSTQTNLQYIEWGDDSIPTLYHSAGEKKVVGFEDGLSFSYREKTMTYEAGCVSSDDIALYVYNLQKEGYIFLKYFDEDSTKLGVESKDANKIIVVDILYPNNQVTIIYTKFKGTLERR